MREVVAGVDDDGDRASVGAAERPSDHIVATLERVEDVASRARRRSALAGRWQPELEMRGSADIVAVRPGLTGGVPLDLRACLLRLGAAPSGKIAPSRERFVDITAPVKCDAEGQFRRPHRRCHGRDAPKIEDCGIEPTGLGM